MSTVMETMKSVSAAWAIGAILWPAPVGAQEVCPVPHEPDASAAYATAFVPYDHWSIDAIHRLAGLGLLDRGHDLSRRAPTQREVGLSLEAAAASDSRYHDLATDFRDRFRDEFGAGAAHVCVTGRPLSYAGSRLGVGWTEHDGRLATGWGYGFYYPGSDWNQPTARPDLSEAGVEGTVQVASGRAAFRATAGYPESDEALREAYVTAAWGRVTGWAGRRTFAWGPSTGPGLVMNGGRYDSFGFLTEPFRLPWLLRHVGPVTLEMGLGQEDFEHRFEDTGFLATRGSVTPHERLQLGVTRAAFFGGEGNLPVDWFDVFSLLIGKHAGDVSSELDNQVVAVDVSFRAPTDRWLPLRAYLEWGFEDSAGAFRDVPGRLVGIDVPAVPGVPALALALERTTFAGTCCGNPIWYRHSTFWDGWTQDGVPLGHPLGGHGEDWSVYARLAALDARLRIGLSGFVRERGIENLYADQRVGESTGGTIRLEGDITGWLTARLDGMLEDGEGWREVALSIGLQAIL